MRVTPCAACNDLDQPIALQLGREVLCDACVRAFPGFFFSADDRLIEVVWGEKLGALVRNEAMLRLSAGKTHFDLGVAYAQKGLRGASCLELALATAAAKTLEDFAEALGRLLTMAKERDTLPMLLRAMGLHLRGVAVPRAG
jgi:hypothetical protein